MEPWREELYGELYHHGILGQKWGRHNGPPYPLAPGNHSASEKKAGWRKSLDKAESVSEGGSTRYGANAYTKALNKTDKARANEFSKYMKNDTKSDKYQAKSNIAKSKGNDKKAEKLKSKSDKYAQKAKESQKKIKDQDAAVDKVLKAAKKQGYDVSKSDFLRMSKSARGKIIANSLIFSAPYAAGFSVLGAASEKKRYGGKYQTSYTDRKGRTRDIEQTSYSVKGTKYKVRKKNS